MIAHVLPVSPCRLGFIYPKGYHPSFIYLVLSSKTSPDLNMFWRQWKEIMFAVVWTADCIAFFISFLVIASFQFLFLSHLGGHTGACSWRITVRLKRMLTRVELYVFSPELSSFPFEIIYSLFFASLWESIALKETKRHVCFFHTAQYFILTSNFPWPPQQSFKSRLCLKSQFAHSRWNIGTVLFIYI